MSSFNDRSNAIEKIILSLSLVFIYLIVIIIANTPGASCYEMSIYEIYPKYFWILILFLLFGGQFILVKNSIYSNYSNFSGVSGISIILLADLILVSIPIVRNYTLFGRADVLTHVGLVLDILNSGFIGSSNSYPIVHILSAQLTLITDMHKYKPPQLIPAIYSLLHLLSFFVLAKFVSRDRGELLLTLAFAFILVFNISISQIVSYSVFAPYSQLILIFPLFIYIFLKATTSNSNYNFRILMIITIFYCVFSHPLSGIGMITMFLVFSSINLACKYKQFNFIFGCNLQSYTNYLLIYIIAFSLWGVYISLFINSISRIIYSILGLDGSSELNSYVNLTNRLSPDLYDLITTIMTIYGNIIIICFILLSSLYYIFKEKKRDPNYLFLSLPISICGLIFLLISFILIFFSSVFPFGRFLAWALLFSPLIISRAICTYLTKIKNQDSFKGLNNLVIIVTLCLILFLISYFSLFTLYASPIAFAQNQQVTTSEILGMEWSFDFMSKDISIFSGQGLSPARFYHALYGVDSLKGKNFLKSNLTQNHFGYDKSLKISYSEGYIVTNYIEKNFYKDVYGMKFGDKYKDKWRFYPEDFIKLGLDPSVNRIYSNGNIETYIIF